MTAEHIIISDTTNMKPFVGRYKSFSKYVFEISNVVEGGACDTYYRY